MKEKRASKSGLFLIELIIAIAFFAVASAICMQLFVKAQLLSSSSLNLSRSVSAATSAASCFKSVGPDAVQVAELLGADAEGGVVRAYYDRNWQPAGDADPRGFTLTMNFYAEDGVDFAEIIVLRERDSELLHSLRTARYQP